MKIESGPVWSKLVGAGAETLTALDERFKVKLPGARWMPSVRAGHWDGCVRYFKIVSGAFMTGFLAEVLLALGEMGHRGIEVERTYGFYDGTQHRGPLEILDGFEPRPYQEAIVDEALRMRRGVIKAATNAGKTEIAMMICRHLAMPTLYVVTEQTLWDQTYERFRTRFGDGTVGRIGAGVWRPRLLTIAMAQSVAPKLSQWTTRSRRTKTIFENNMPAPIMVLFADEVHLFTGGKKGGRGAAHWQLVLEKIPAPWRFGMSGTPLTETETRDRNLVGLTGPLFAEVSNRELVDMGFSALPRITFVRYGGLPEKKGYAEAYKDQVVEGERRNRAIAELCRAHAGEKTLVLCNWERHARIVKQMLARYSIGAVVLSGRDDVWTRKRWLREFKTRGLGSLDVLVVTPIFDQGVDIPEIDVLVMAGGGGVSPVKPLQRLGRGLRRRPDKDEVVVYDFDDRFQKDLARHSRRRMQLFRAEQFTVQCKTIEEIGKE